MSYLEVQDITGARSYSDHVLQESVSDLIAPVCRVHYYIVKLGFTRYKPHVSIAYRFAVNDSNCYIGPFIEGDIPCDFLGTPW